MIERYAIGIGVFVALGVFWMLIQSLWRRVFTNEIEEADVLSARGNCSNCGCMGGVCETKNKKVITDN